METHDAHMQTLNRLVEMQKERIDTTVLKYEKDRKVGLLVKATFVHIWLMTQPAWQFNADDGVRSFTES